MNNSQIISTAMAQSATDLGCAREDFIKDKNIIVESTTDPNARKYLKLPFTEYIWRILGVMAYVRGGGINY